MAELINQGTTVRDSACVVVNFTRPGGSLLKLPAVQSVTFPSLAVDSREKTNLDSGSFKEFSPGLVDPGEVSMTALFNPSHPVYLEIQKSLAARETAAWQATLPEVIVKPITSSVTAGAAAIAVTGAVTFTGTEEAPNLANYSIGVGAALKINSTIYLVESISSTNAIKVTSKTGGSIGAAVTASVYSIVQPEVTIGWNGFLTSVTPSAETDANMTVEFAVKVTGKPTSVVV